uniref:Uncharacterized protein n=1 Tax=Strigamia maritima TaxID=126957 RepID=T1IJS5_STRMM
MLIPCLRSRIYKYVITGFIAFGLGFMIGDAVLHLIPEAIGTECEGDHHKHTALWRQVLIMLTIFELKPLAMVILLGDAVHNFGDGLAVGAAFTSGLQSGISTSLAIFCHELPHEFGDFVILRSTGLSIQYALLANLASALTAFLGLYVGVSLGFDQSTRQWIFAFTAAMFLYIAVGDMLPELRNHNKSFSVLAVQSASMLVGMGIVLLMHIYVETLF